MTPRIHRYTAPVFCDRREGLEPPDLQLLFAPGSTHALEFGQFDDKPAVSCTICWSSPTAAAP